MTILRELQSRYDLQLDKAAVAPGLGASRLWLIPGTAGICMLAEISAQFGPSTCTAEVPESGFIGVWGGDPDGQWVIGFVANGNRTVRITLADGRTLVARVVNNAVVAHTTNSNGLRTMQFRGVTGTPQLVDITIPATS
jgi:hypothetical protein